MPTWRQIKDNPLSKKSFTLRAEILRAMRDFFWQKDFLETDTSIANPCGGQEPYLDPAEVSLIDERGVTHPHYLQTSPEYAMKKLLAAGYEKIFQICHCFRNHESFGGRHFPEFLMIEWYRLGAKYSDIMDDTEEIVKFVAQKIGVEFLTVQDKKIAINEKWDRYSMREIWQKFIGVELNDYLTLESMTELAKTCGYQVDEKDLYEDVFYKIFLNEIEPKLGVERPVFIYEYPVSMAALARVCPEDDRYAERFELYVGGVELANAFGELLDGEEQRKRFVEEQNLRSALGKKVFAIDEDLIAALNELKKENAIASGIALGVDRLIMLLAGARDLREVRLLSED